MSLSLISRTTFRTPCQPPATTALSYLTNYTARRALHPTPRRPLTMTTTTTQRSTPHQEYLIIIPDFSGTTAQRTQAQPGHIEKATPMIDDGTLTYFGVMLTKHVDGEQDHRPNINGSAIVMKAESEEAVREYLRSDAYAAAGVWDVERARIWSFRSG